MNKDYPWAMNMNKLGRAIEQVRHEQQPPENIQVRTKELYVLYGGKLNNDTTNNNTTDKAVEIEESAVGGSSSPDDSSLV